MLLSEEHTFLALQVRLLLDGGSASLNTADDFGVRPLHKAVAFRRVAVLRELLREPCVWTRPVLPPRYDRAACGWRSRGRS